LTGFTYNRDAVILINLQVQAPEHPLFRPGRVAEPNIAEFNLPREGFLVNFLTAGLWLDSIYGGWVLSNLKDGLCCKLGLAHVRSILTGLARRHRTKDHGEDCIEHVVSPNGVVPLNQQSACIEK